MRDHTPYTDWILSEETLRTEEASRLQAHLQECDACRRLSNEWDATQTLLSAHTMVEPRPGFTGRWKSHATIRQRQSGLLRTWAFLPAALASILVLVAGGFLASGQSAADLLAASRNAAASAFANMAEAIQKLVPVSLLESQSIPPIYWIVGGLLLLGILALWFILLRYIASRNEKE
jgi:anti-sigma factor RsiW